MRRIPRILGHLLVGSLVGVFLLWDAIPPAQCTVANAKLYTPEQMRDLAFSNRAIWGDQEAAACWFQKSAEAGNRDSYSTVGMNYEEGRGVPQDVELAMAWYKKAIEAGNSGGAYRMSLLYRSGNGVAGSEEKADAYVTLQQSLKNSEPPFESESGAAKKLKSIYQAARHADQHLLRWIGRS